MHVFLLTSGLDSYTLIVTKKENIYHLIFFQGKIQYLTEMTLVCNNLRLNVKEVEVESGPQMITVRVLYMDCCIFLYKC